MNILYICEEYPPGKTGGIGIATEILANGMIQKGHSVFVIGLCEHGYGAPDFEVKPNGTKIWRLRYATDIGLVSAKSRLRDKVLVHGMRALGILSVDSKLQFKKLIVKIQAIISEFQIDLVEMADWNNFFFNLSSSKFNIPKLKAPLLVKMHGSFNYFRAESNLPINNHFFELEQKLYARADALAAVSSYTANFTRGLYDLTNDISILYNGIEVTSTDIEFRPPNIDSVIFSGTLLKKKGIYDLAKAWNKVIKKRPNATLHIYGKGDQNKVKAYLTSEAAKRIVFYGHVPRTELLFALSRADLAVFPSYSETFGMAAVEAMSIGCAVIFTKLSCGPEILQDKMEGWLVNPANNQELADTVVSALEQPLVRIKMGKQAKQRVLDQFSLQKAIEAHEHVYLKIRKNFESIRGDKF